MIYVVIGALELVAAYYIGKYVGRRERPRPTRLVIRIQNPADAEQAGRAIARAMEREVLRLARQDTLDGRRRR